MALYMTKIMVAEREKSSFCIFPTSMFVKKTMETTIKNPEPQSDLEADIQFYKQEINFLLKTLTKEYSICMTHQPSVKLLDSYWKEFEKYKHKLTELEHTIHVQKQELVLFCKKKLTFSEAEEKKISAEFHTIIQSLKKIKKNFYNYLESDLKHKITFSLS